MIDILAPVLLESTPVSISTEQTEAIRKVLILCSSDSNFAQKAADSLKLILLGGVNQGVVIQSINPPQRQSGSTLNLTVLGVGFDMTSKINFNGIVQPTTFTSSTELKSTISLVGIPPQSIPVFVVNGQGIQSNTMYFNVT